MFPQRVTHKPLLHPTKIQVWIFHKPCLCFLFMSCLNTQRHIPSMENSLMYLLGIRRAEQQSSTLQNEEERAEAASSLQGLDINQTNYGATAVLKPRRGNEMIRGRSQLNTEWVNEYINYLMIYWECGAPPTPDTPPTTTTTESICFNWVIIRMLHLADSLDLSG